MTSLSASVMSLSNAFLRMLIRFLTAWRSMPNRTKNMTRSLKMKADSQIPPIPPAAGPAGFKFRRSVLAKESDIYQEAFLSRFCQLYEV